MFEVKAKDLLGRVGEIKTKRGVIKTPYMFPVISTTRQIITTRELKEKFRVNAVITNAYLLWKKYGDEVAEKGIHDFIDFDGIIMTDSGAYQLLIYGDVNVSPDEIILYQQKIGSDIAVILDYPSGTAKSYEDAKRAVEITLERAKKFITSRKQDGILWVGPVQGSPYVDLVRYSAKAMRKLNFDIYAIGSQTIVMEQYDFKRLVNVFMNSRILLPHNVPIHLFGAGHPIMFSLAVAMGADLFDSAAYALYAKNDRYITPEGTLNIKDLKEMTCACPVCSRYTPDEIRKLPKNEREKLLAEHNLYVSLEEIRKIKQAIYDGRLWEYMQSRLRAHPRLLEGFKEYTKYSKFIEKLDPISKNKAMFYLGSEDVMRPELVRHRRKIINYPVAKFLKKALIIDEENANDKPHIRLEKLSKKVKENIFREYHVLFLSSLFGIVPAEISHIYPLLQYESPNEVDIITIRKSAKHAYEYLSAHKHNYKEYYLFTNNKKSKVLKRLLALIERDNDLKKRIKEIGNLNELDNGDEQD
ncbi:MAG: tRNA guanosine(15) transglycosylase TgtA [Candidatus Asgardarchaeia archaeon]